MCRLFGFLCLVLLLGFSCDATEEQSHGTLIVSYQTGSQEERLDRVRFRLQNEKQEDQFHPKKSALMSDNNCQHRFVVIENLPVGKYTLQFIIPNKDHFFAEVPLRKFELHSDQVLKISQLIRPLHMIIEKE